MSLNEDFEQYEMEWKISPTWSEIINNLYNEEEDNNEENPSEESPVIIQNGGLKKLIKEKSQISTLSILDRLLSFEPTISPKNEDIDYNSIKLIEFKKIKVDQLKEDILYYCSSPKILLNYKKIDLKETKYDFYKDLEIENFMICQKERADIILKYEDIISSQIKEDDINICVKTSFLENNEKNKLIMKEIYLLNQKLNKYNFIELKEMDNRQIITYLKEIIDILKMRNDISPYGCGIINYNMIINNLALIIEIISNKFNDKKDNIIELLFLLRDICYYISSFQLKFNFIKLIKEKINLLKDKDIDYKDNNIYMENYLNFDDINSNANYKLAYLDFRMFLDNQDYDQEIDNVNNLNLNNHWTIVSGKTLFLFIQNPYKLKINKGRQFLIYFQIDLELNKVINFGKIVLINEANAKTEKIIDINLSIKKDIIYLFYIIKFNKNDEEKYYLKYKIYNNAMINLDNTEEKNKIEFSSFIPIRLINDSKYLYCFSNTEKICIVKINYNFNQFNKIKYAICKFDISNFKMYNTFSINNYLILENIKENKKYSAIINKNKNEEYIIQIYKLSDVLQVIDNKESNNILKIAFNDNRYVVTKLNIKSLELYFHIFENDDKNKLFLFPFSDSYLDYTINNCYDKYLKEICFLLNIYGNNEKSDQLILLSSIFNFRKCDLKYSIQNMIENKEIDEIKLYYIIILRTLIKYMIQSDKLDEIELKKIILFFREIIVEGYTSKNKDIYYQIIKEIIIISSYIKHITIIEFANIKFIFDESKDSKLQILLLKLLIEQEKTNKDINLYKLIMDIEFNFIKNMLSHFESHKSAKLKKYYLLNEVMKKAADTLNKKIYNDKIFNNFLDIFLILSKYINEIIELYKNLINSKHNYITYLSILYDSFIFRSFLFILQKIIANKIYIKNNEIISSLYKNIILLDKINIHEIGYYFYDLENIIEVKSSLFLNTNISGYQNTDNQYNYQETIKLKKPKNILIKTSLTSHNNLNDYFDIILYKNNNDNQSYFVNLNFENGHIFRNISKIEITMKNRDSIFLRDFLLNIIPLKEDFKVREYYIQKNINDNKIILLMEKSIIHYFLSLFEDIHNQIDEFNNDKIISQHSKLYEYEILKFITTSSNNNITISKEEEKDTPVITKINQLKIKIGNTLGYDFDIKLENINQNLMNLFEDINKQMKINNNINFDTIKIEKLEEFPNKKKYKILDMNKYEKIFILFKNDIKNKNKVLSQRLNNQLLDNLIYKLFFISIKYYDCLNQLDNLLIKINKLNDKFNKTEDYNYNLFYPIYEESSKSILLYYEKKFGFNYEEKIDNEILKKLENILDFLYDIIYPSDTTNLEPNSSIAKSVLYLLKTKTFEIKEIKKYCEIQNINCEIKFIELMIISNLLNSLQNETNIAFLLQLIGEKIRKSKTNSFFDKTMGANYLILEKLKHQFHILLSHLSNKYLKNKYRLTTELLFIENLILKIRGRNFPILSNIIKVFEELKSFKINNEEEIFKFQHNCLYNFKYYNKFQKYHTLLEIFKIIAGQILQKKQVKLNNFQTIDLSLTRDISKISSFEYNNIFQIIWSYFTDIKPDNIFYHDFILFFYKNLINSKEIWNYIKTQYIGEKIIIKIIKIALDLEENNHDDNERKPLSQLIMIKLLYQIIEREDDLFYIFNLNDLLNENKDENPYIFLYKIIFKKLDEINENNILKKYYIKTLLLCLNKLMEHTESHERKEFINNNLGDIRNIILLISDEIPWLIESKFILDKDIDANLSEIALFCSRGNKSLNHGEIICFLDSDSEKLFSNYISNFRNTYFYQNEFNFYLKNFEDKFKSAFVIIEEQFDIDSINLSNLEIIPINNITIIKNEDYYIQKQFIDNYKDIIIQTISNEFKNNKLNDKGIYFMLLIISKLINNLTKEQIMKIFEYIWNYYIINKKEEDESDFISFELIENIIDKRISYFYQRHKYIEKEENNNENIIKEFTYAIKNDDFYLNLNRSNLNLIFRECLCNPILEKNKDEEISKIYDIDYNLNYLYFYKYNETYNDDIINEDNSILFSDSIRNTSILSELSKLIENNYNKIKIIFIKFLNFNDDFNLLLIDFIKKNKIPIFIIESNISNIIYEYFIEGKGNIFNYTIRTNSNLNYYYNGLLNNEENIKKEYSIENKEKNEKIEKIEKNQKKEYIYLDIGSLFDVVTEKKADVNKFEMEKKIVYDLLINKPKRFFKIGAIKSSKRLIFDLICENKLKFSEIKTIVGNIENLINIFNYLCMEYYYNVRVITKETDFFIINNAPLKDKLNRYLLFLSSEKLNNINNTNEWLLKYFDYLKECLLLSQASEKYDSSTLSNYLSKFDINSKLKSISYNQILFSDQDIEYDVFLFFSKNCLDNNNFPIKIFLELIEIKIKYLLKINFKEGILTSYTYKESFDKKIKINNDCEVTFIFELMNNLYEYYINNINKIINENFKELFITSQINNLMIQFIEKYIDLQTFFYDSYNDEELKYSKMRGQNISLKIEYTFKFYDFCLLLYLRHEDKLNLFEYLNYSMKDLFKFYCNYKLLTIDKNSEINNKEMYAFLSYIIYICNRGIDKNIKININDVGYSVEMNSMNIYKIKEDNLDNIKLSKNSSLKEIYEKTNFYNLIILYHNKKTGLYTTNDIINIQDLENNSGINIKKVKGYDDIILYPLGKIIPIIFYYNQTNSEINEKNIPIKLNKKIYTNNYLYKQKYFNEPFYLNKNNEAFYISDENRQKYTWLKYVSNIEDIIPKIKFCLGIRYLYADYNNCFIIAPNGQLFGIGDNTYNQITDEKNNNIKEWTVFSSPKNCNSFKKCVCGKDYILCLIQDYEGNYKLYAKGNNDKYQCGISTNKLITVLTECEFSKDIQIKDIFANEYFSAAITTDSKLYIWGSITINTHIEHLSVKKEKTFKIPTLVVNNDILIEHIAINPKNKNTQIFVIGNSLNKNGDCFRSKKCFSLEIENELTLKEITPWNTNNIPLLVYSHEDGYYILYFDENKYIHEINKDKSYLYSFYNSKNLDIFIKEINSFTEKDVTLFIDIIEQIKELNKKGDIIENILLNQFMEYIKDKKSYKQLFNLFKNNNKYLFDYLKYRSIIISKHFMKYYHTNMLSAYKKLLQPLIVKNTIFLTSEARINFFLSRLNFSRNYTQYRINIDRIKANSFIEKFKLNDSSKKLIDSEINITIFGQALHELEKLKSKDFFLEKNKRLFKVTLLGENAVDEGGPYHEIISEMSKDLQSDYLDLFIKTPNNKNDLGDLRDRYIINPDANKYIHQKAFQFFGKLIILAISTGEALNLNLHPIIFKLLLNNEITFDDFETLDYNSFKLIKDLTEAFNKNDSEFINQMGLNFEIKNTNGSDIELKPNGKDIDVDINNVNEYINIFKLKRLEEFNSQIKEIQKGLFAGIPLDSLQILNWRQLELIICGKKSFDIDDFKKHTVYDGFNKDEQVIKWFWEWFESISEEDKFKYLRFVSGRTRLPQTNFGNNYKHTINKVYNKELLPNSHTCFFTLHLPDYNDKNDLIKKFEYAIENSLEINDS